MPQPQRSSLGIPHVRFPGTCSKFFGQSTVLMRKNRESLDSLRTLAIFFLGGYSSHTSAHPGMRAQE